MSSGPTGTSIADQCVRWCFRHWLALMNGAVLLYGGLPWLAPVLMASGFPGVGQFIFRLYTPLCHQVAERSFFFLGYQVAFCHREAAMYTSLFIGGVLYTFVRERLKPISLRTMGLLLLPMLVDGMTHMINDLVPFVALRSDIHTLWSFNWWLRMITGVLFTCAVVAGIYPRLERSFRPRPPQDASYPSI